MIEEDLQSNERKSADVNKFLDFNNLLLDFRVVLEDTVNSYVQFWQSLMDPSPNLNKIKSIGSNITRACEKSRDEFDRLCALNPNNLEFLNMYSHFLANVVNDSVSSEKIFENIKVIKKNLGANKIFSDEEKLKYGENSLTGIITISGNTHTLGVILHCNTQVKSIIGYYMSDLIGQNISRVMPKIIGDHHDEILKGYLETSEERLNGKERFAPMINKEGFLVPCTIMTKSLPNL
jgi:PAS domain S-box-containing protein